MVPAQSDGADPVTLPALPLSRVAVIVTIASTLVLAGCGRKGPLDPPPGAALPNGPAGAAAQPSEAPPAAKEKSPLDWLID